MLNKGQKRARVEWQLTGVDTDEHSSDHEQFRCLGRDTGSRAAGTNQREDLTHQRRALPAHCTRH